MGCLLCGRGIPGCTECPPNMESEGIMDYDAEKERRGPGRPQKPDEEITKSAGRKRAGIAIEEKLRNNRVCEWAGKANCGGGKYPIIGCINNVAKHVHHGPDKNTSNNTEDNLHNICTQCHNRWHAENDKDHDSTIKHSPRSATQEELILAIGGFYQSERTAANRDS